MYEVGDKVEYKYGGYILFGTVTEVRRSGYNMVSGGYMISGLKKHPIFIREDNVIGRFE